MYFTHGPVLKADKNFTTSRKETYSTHPYLQNPAVSTTTQSKTIRCDKKTTRRQIKRL